MSNSAFKERIISGIQVLYALNLKGRPAHDQIVATAKIWIQVIEPLREWHDDNLAALTTAFNRAAAELEEWPAPREIIVRIPRTVRVFKALPPPTIDEAGKRQIDEICAEIYNDLKIK